MEIKGRKVVHAEIEGVDSSDYPDFCDAYFSYAEFLDGTPLTDDELETLTDEYADVINEMACEDMVCWADDARDRMMDR